MNSTEFNYTVVSTFETSEKDTKMEKGKTYKQFLAGVVSNIASVAIGTTLGWTSPTATTFENEDLSPLGRPTTKDEDSWIGSLVALGALIAPFVAGPLTEILGRKKVLWSCSIFFAVSFIILGFAEVVGLIYFARILQGFGVGIAMTVLPMYIGEIAEDSYRGALGSFMQLFIVSGILVVYAVGPYVNYVALQFVCLSFPILFAIGFFFMPDTPAYFLSKGQKSNAIDSLRFLRGKSADGVQDELAKIQADVEESQKNKGSILDLVKNKGNLKALIICVGLIMFQQLSGINVILFYSQTIFKKTGSDLEPAIATILVGSVQVIASGCTPLIVERLGRKIILLGSAGGMAISLGTMGLYFYLDIIESPAVESIGWLPVASLIMFVTVYCVGFGPLPWAVLGEMFPGSVKSYASTIVASTCWTLGFFVTKYFSALDDAVGSAWAFWMFGIFCAIAFVFTYFVVLETKGMSLQQIQDKLNGRS